MKILFVNGSPKNTGSVSELLIEGLKQKLDSTNEYAILHAMKLDKQELIDGLKDADAVVFAFPLYVDALPSHLLRLLRDVKKEAGQINPKLTVYAVANNGFLEGQQNHLALAVLRNFCVSAGISWGQGVGVGAGHMLHAAPVGHGPLKSLGAAFDALAVNIQRGASGDDIFTQPNFPKFLFKLFGNRVWIRYAKKNGLKRKDLYHRH